MGPYQKAALPQSDVSSWLTENAVQERTMCVSNETLIVLFNEQYQILSSFHPSEGVHVTKDENMLNFSDLKLEL